MGVYVSMCMYVVCVLCLQKNGVSATDFNLIQHLIMQSLSRNQLRSAAEAVMTSSGDKRALESEVGSPAKQSRLASASSVAMASRSDSDPVEGRSSTPCLVVDEDAIKEKDATTAATAADSSWESNSVLHRPSVCQRNVRSLSVSMWTFVLMVHCLLECISLVWDDVLGDPHLHVSICLPDVRSCWPLICLWLVGWLLFFALRVWCSRRTW
jgi:hypothetical protein